MSGASDCNAVAAPAKSSFRYQIVALYLDDPDSPTALVAMPIDDVDAAPFAGTLTE